MFKEKKAVLFLSVLEIILMLTASLAGIILDDGGDPYPFTSLREEVVEIYGGQGLYQYDTITKAVMFRGFDWANLVICFPLFILGIYLYRREQLKGQLLLGGIFSYLVYNYSIGVMGNAYNIMFLVWLGLFSIGFFGLAIILKGVDILAFSKKLEPGFPRKSLSVYMIILGLFIPIVYLIEIVSAYATRSVPASLAIYTTLELAALEIAIMAPLHLLGGILLWKQISLGYIISVLLVFTSGITFISLTVFQLLAYDSFQIGGLGDILRFVVLAGISSAFSIVIFKKMKN